MTARPELDAVLAWVNKTRAERGVEPILRLPKGIRRDPGRCPLALALGAYSVGPAESREGVAYWESYEDLEEMEETPLAPYANVFALAFDDGKYPELEVRLGG